MKKLEELKSIADTNLDKLDMSQDAKDRLKREVKLIKRKRLGKLGFAGIPAVAAVIAFILFFTGTFSGYSPVQVYAKDLMEEITPQKVQEVELSNDFIRSTADFSVNLFKRAYSKDKSSLISPTSVYLALGMVANGADGSTLKEFETLLGSRGINVNELNKYYYSLSRDLTGINTGRLSIANSIWYRNDDGIDVKKSFLQANADFYSAAAYKADFKSKDTVKDINNWVKNNTGGLIDKVVENINYLDLMYLIDAVYFEDQWERPFEKGKNNKGSFTLQDGTKLTSDFMYSPHEIYIKDYRTAEGFMKPYKSGKYSFVALLPNENISLESYINSLTGDSFMKLLKDNSKGTVDIRLPKFKAQDEIKLETALMQMGLKESFDAEKANFAKMGSSKWGNIYIQGVLHKTFIELDETGTKAAAVTSMTMAGGAAKPHVITFDRPFVYAIIDNATKLPLFIGTMMKPQV